MTKDKDGKQAAPSSGVNVVSTAPELGNSSSSFSHPLMNDNHFGSPSNPLPPLTDSSATGHVNETSSAMTSSGGSHIQQQPDVKLLELKKRQTILRRQLTASLNELGATLRIPIPQPSRRLVKAFTDRIETQWKSLDGLNELVSTCLVDDKPGLAKQNKKHNEYLRDYLFVMGDAEDYLDKRKDDAPSVASHTSQRRHNVIDPHEQQRRAAAQLQREEDKARAEEARQLAEQALRDAERRVRDLEVAEQPEESQSTSSESSVVPPVRSPTAQQYILAQRKLNTGTTTKPSRTHPQLPSSSGVGPLPDDWIDEYIKGKGVKVNRSSSISQPNFRVDLPVFPATYLDWFWWIDLFYSLVHNTAADPSEKLAILKEKLKDTDAKNLIYGLGGGEDYYKEGLRRLKDCYGNRKIIRSAHVQVLEAMDFKGLDSSTFRATAQKARTHLFDLGRIGGTCQSDLIERLCRNLPKDARVAWNSDPAAAKMDNRSLNDFGDWLCARATFDQDAYSIAAAQLRLSDPRSSGGGGGSRDGRASGFKHRDRPEARFHHTDTRKEGGGTREKRKPFCFKCEGEHYLPDCRAYKELPLRDRVKFCLNHMLCFCCLGPGHSSRDCSSKSCEVDGCTTKHHRLLHEFEAERCAATRTASVRRKRNKRVALGVINLHAVGLNGELIPVNLMYDECSTSTLVREALARQLGLQIDMSDLDIIGVGGHRSTVKSAPVTLHLRTCLGEIIILECTTHPTVTDPAPWVNWNELQARWTHLADLPLKPTGGRVDILLGLNHGHLMAVMDARNGGEDEPFASLTRLGWVVRGVIGVDPQAEKVKINSTICSVPAEQEGPELAAALHRLFESESFGTEHRTSHVVAEHHAASKMLDSGTKKLSDGYETCILWRPGHPKLSNNLSLAESRNRSLENKFRRDPDYERRYRRAMQVNFDEGYAVRLSPEEVLCNAPVYYLPHFSVSKGDPEDPKAIRIVYDGAAKFKGLSLNDAIHSGPPLQNALPAVVIRFREGEVAWASDIKAMFSRIRLSQSDQQYHGFLWTEEDGTVSVCRMTRVTFGVNCSPFVAIKTTWRAADDAGPAMVEAATAIRTNLYVDDYLGSAKNVSAAVKIASEVEQVLAGGDFHLRGWVSNNPAFLATLHPLATLAQGEPASHPLTSETSEKVLGIFWSPDRDTLGFKIRGLDDVVYTRRGLASKVAKLFDPQGMAAPMVMKARSQLRVLGLKGYGFDDKIIGEHLSWWQAWFHTLEQLNFVEFPRCLFQDEDNIIRTELHTFGDASEEAFAAVCFIRNVYRNGSIIVRQIKSSIKLSQLKTISIPKLELNAAVLSARIAHFVEESLTKRSDGRSRLDARYFWTDSSTVRHWIRATAGEYVTFVSNRVGEIQLLTQQHEWRFVPGKLNPADAATRSTLEAEALPYIWICGARFLYEREERWPKDLDPRVIPDEKKPIQVMVSRCEAQETDWEKVVIQPENLSSVIQLREDYRSLILACQEEQFGSEIKQIRRGENLSRDSRLLELTPKIGEDGIIRVGGRIRHAQLPYDSIHPIILPGRHPLSILLVKAYHQKLRHLGTDFVLSHIRQHFWIIGGREAVKKIRRNCHRCKLDRAKPASQLMGDLPESRLAAGTPPFSRTAVDYFGPMETSASRNTTTKRWGALFTCMVTRAVYLDLAHSLSADDFLLVLRRFVSIYGRPVRIHSDNGTCFVGAERELREAVETLNGSGSITGFCKKEGIEWIFQPPRTPHFGGAHESLVRSTKRALYAALDEEKKGLRFPRDNVLQTVLFEVAGLLNTRPLTYTSSDPSDFRALTPNDLLNRPSTADVPAGNFDRALPRDYFRFVQRIVNFFWSQWKGPFLQSMAARKKWKREERNLAVGDFVAELDPQLRRGEWRTGFVDAVYPGEDGLVRVIDFRTSDGAIYNRGISRVSLLEPNSSASQLVDSGEDVAANNDMDPATLEERDELPPEGER